MKNKRMFITALVFAIICGLTETNQVEIINVKSANQDLLHYAKERLSQSNVVANGLLQGNSYKISFRFVEARRTW
jgi:hypothetical protein